MFPVVFSRILKKKKKNRKEVTGSVLFLAYEGPMLMLGDDKLAAQMKAFPRSATSVHQQS